MRIPSSSRIVHGGAHGLSLENIEEPWRDVSIVTPHTVALHAPLRSKATDDFQAWFWANRADENVNPARNNVLHGGRPQECPQKAHVTPDTGIGGPSKSAVLSRPGWRVTWECRVTAVNARTWTCFFVDAVMEARLW